MDKRIIIELTAGDTITIAGNTPWNLTSYTITSTIKDNYGDGATVASFGTATQGTTGFVLTMNAADSGTYLTPYIGVEGLVFDIKFAAGGGAVTHTEKAFLRVNKAVT